MRRLLPLLLFLASIGSAFAQGGVLQSGVVTPGHIVQWLSNGIIGDGGTPTTGAVVQSGSVSPGHVVQWVSGGLIADGGVLSTGTVTQTGAVTPGHAVQWVGTNVIADGGTPASASVTQSGPVTAGHFVAWLSNNVIVDGGALPTSGVLQSGFVLPGHLVQWLSNSIVSDSGLPFDYALPLTGGTLSGALIIASGGAAITGNVGITGNGSVTGSMALGQQAAAASTQALRADQSWQTIATYTPSGAASQVFPLSTTFRRFRLTLQGMSVGTNAAVLSLQFSSDGGSTYKTTLYNYAFDSVDNVGTAVLGGSVAAGGVLISAQLPNPSSGNTWDATFDVFPGSAVDLLRVRGNGYGSTGPLYQNIRFGGGWNSTPLARMNFARVVVNTGNFSGTIILEGLP